MKKMMILTLMLCSVYFVHAGEPDHLGDRFTSIEIYGDPFVPALSSFRWARGLDLFKSADNINSFQLEIWTLTDTAYLLPLPFFNFFELGLQLSYYPFVTPRLTSEGRSHSLSGRPDHQLQHQTRAPDWHVKEQVENEECV
jgi:hypothetical protein